MTSRSKTLALIACGALLCATPFLAQPGCSTLPQESPEALEAQSADWESVWGVGSSQVLQPVGHDVVWGGVENLDAYETDGIEPYRAGVGPEELVDLGFREDQDQGLRFAPLNGGLFATSEGWNLTDATGAVIFSGTGGRAPAVFARGSGGDWSVQPPTLEEAKDWASIEARRGRPAGD